MKKTIISILSLAAGIMILAGCEKENNATASSEGVKTLSATFPESPTKTAIDGKNCLQVNWSAGDEIIVYSNESTSAKFTLADGAGTRSGYFTGAIADTPKAAFYPYDTANRYGDETASVVHIPNLQIVPEGSFDPKAALMTGTIYEDRISFTWAVTFFRITAPADVKNLAAIVLSGPIFTGNMSINTSAGDCFMVSSTTFSITVKPKDGAFVAGSDYYATAICSSYRNAPLKVTYIYVDEETHKAVTKAKDNKNDFSADNGTVTHIPAIDMTDAETHTATQLEKDGPFYADFNLGATITDYGKLSTTTADNTSLTGFDALYCTENVGGLYAWNNAQSGFPNARVDTPWKPGTTGNTSRDTATEFWGGAWRQPTYPEILYLANDEETNFAWKSTSSYCEGCTLSGYKITCTNSNAYTENSIFLPDAGYYYYNEKAIKEQGVEGRYWSCDPFDHPNSYAYALNGQSVYAAEYRYGMSIRPVLALNGNILR